MRGMKSERTWAWWATRIEFAIAIGAVLVAVLWLLVLGGVNSPTFTGNDPIRLGTLLLPGWLSISIAALLAALFGVAWMIRIYRNLREPEPPSWRYRGR